MSLHETIESASSKRVLFLGEEIVDVYHYGRMLARPLKEPILCMEHVSSEAWAGGVHAAARHAEAFCATVHVASSVRLRKERHVEQAHTRKLFEVYSGAALNELPLLPRLSEYDVVIVTDYGHGMFAESLIERVCAEAKFLAVNVQSNAGNYGFNLATKWPRADYLCLDEPEARLSTQNRDGPIVESLEELACIAPKVVITLGKNGAVGTGNVHVPAFVEPTVDTMGAGDAFFAVTACMAEGADMRDLLTIGNIAGKLKTQVIGHREAVTKHALLTYLASQSR